MSTSINQTKITTCHDLGLKENSWKFLVYHQDIFNDYEDNRRFDLLNNQIFKSNPFPEIRKRYSEPQRFYHNENHLMELISLIEMISKDLDAETVANLFVVAYFHDSVYDPKSNENEYNSAELFCSTVLSQWNINSIDEHPYAERIKLIKNTILETDYRILQVSSKLAEIFNALDIFSLSHYPLHKLIEFEDRISKEYQFYDYLDYYSGRLAVLEKFKSKINNPNLELLINYVRYRKVKIGIYPGSFRPFHVGHMDILNQSEKIFDKVIIARGINPEKSDTSFQTVIENFKPYRQVENFNGYLVDYIASKIEKQKELEKHLSLTNHGIENLIEYCVIRGLRNPSDFEFENKQLLYSKYLASKRGVSYKTAFFISKPEFQHISSSDIRGMEKLVPGSADDLIVV